MSLKAWYPLQGYEQTFTEDIVIPVNSSNTHILTLNENNRKEGKSIGFEINDAEGNIDLYWNGLLLGTPSGANNATVWYWYWVPEEHINIGDNLFTWDSRGDGATIYNITVAGGFDDWSGNGHYLIDGTNGTEPSNNGKIGSALRSNDYGSYAESNNPVPLDGDTTMMCWVYIESYSTNNSAGGLISQHNHTNNTGLALGYTGDGTTTYMTISEGNGSARTYNKYKSTATLDHNKWYHLAVSYDDNLTLAKFYINGEYDSEHTITNGSILFNNVKFGIFTWSIGHQSSSDFRIIGNMNDVRVYDEVVDDFKIKEISKAKVGEYKLNSVERNLAKRLDALNANGAASIISKEYNEITFSFPSGDTSNWRGVRYDSANGPITGPGKTYSYIWEVYPSSDCNVYCDLNNAGQTTNTGTNDNKSWDNLANRPVSANKWTTVSVSWTNDTGQNWIDYTVFGVENGWSIPANFTMKIRNLRLIEGIHDDYDFYRYQSNGQLIDNSEFLNNIVLDIYSPSLSKNNGRDNDNVYKFNEGSNLVSPNISVLEYTMGCWVYPMSITNETHFLSFYKTSDPGRMLFGTSNGSSKLWQWIAGTSVRSDSDLELNKWQHVVARRDSSGVMNLFLNGIKQQESGINTTPTPLDTAFGIGHDRDLSYTGSYTGEDLFIENAFLYASSLSDGEISEIYSEEKDSDSLTDSPQKGLIAWYKLDGKPNDSSGNGYHLTNKDTPTSNSGKIGKCYNFNGTSDIMRVHYGKAEISSMTISYWCYHTISQAGDKKIVAVSEAFNTQIQNDLLNIYVSNGTSWGTVYSNIELPLATWTHITYRFENGNIDLFINGTKSYSQDTYSTLKSYSNFDGDISVGARVNTSNVETEHFAGRLNDVRIYDKVLSDKEIYDISKAKILHYTFNSREEKATKNIIPNGIINSYPTIGNSHGTYQTSQHNGGGSAYFNIGTIGSITGNLVTLSSIDHKIWTYDILNPQTTGGGVTAGTNYFIRKHSETTFSLHPYDSLEDGSKGYQRNTASGGIGFEVHKDVDDDTNRIAISASGFPTMWHGAAHKGNGGIVKEIRKNGFGKDGRYHDCIRIHQGYYKEVGAPVTDYMAYKVYPIVESGKTYSFSFYYRAVDKATADKNTSINFRLHTTTGWPNSVNIKIDSLEWKKCTLTSVAPGSGGTNMYFQPSDHRCGMYEFSEIQCEEGIPTEYTEDERTENGIIRDVSGYNNHAILDENAPQWVDDSKLGISSYYFSDRQELIRKELDVPAGNSITLTAWIKTGVNGEDDYHDILSINSAEYEMSAGPGGFLRTGFYVDGIRKVFNSGTGLFNNEWRMVSMTYDGANIIAYIDGKESGRLSAPGSLGSGFKKVLIGEYYDPPGTYGSRQLYQDDTRIYATALSAEDILNLYESRANIDSDGNFSANQFDINGFKRSKLDYSGWTLGATDSNGIGGVNEDYTTDFNRNGDVDESLIREYINPIGEVDIVWGTSDAPTFNNSSDGGFNTGHFAIDNTKLYRFTTWIRRENVFSSAAGTTYYGLHGYNSSETSLAIETFTGSSTTNPYFCSFGDDSYRGLSSKLPQDEWLYYVGYVYPVGYNGMEYGDEGIWHSDGTRLVPWTTGYRWPSDCVGSMLRAYLFYSSDNKERQYFYRPRVDEMNWIEHTDNVIGSWKMTKTRYNNIDGSYYVRDNTNRSIDMLMVNDKEGDRFRVINNEASMYFDDNNYLRSRHETNMNVLSGSLTMIAKIRWNGASSTSNGEVIIACKEDYYEWRITRQEDGSGLFQRAIRPDWSWRGSLRIQPGETVFVANTYGATGNQMYVGRYDGILSSQNGGGTNEAVPTSYLESGLGIGARGISNGGDGGRYMFQGDMFEVKLIDDYLTSAEIKNEFKRLMSHKDHELSMPELLQCKEHRPLLNNKNSVNEKGIASFNGVSEIGITDGMIACLPLTSNVDNSGYSHNAIPLSAGTGVKPIFTKDGCVTSYIDANNGGYLEFENNLSLQLDAVSFVARIKPDRAGGTFWSSGDNDINFNIYATQMGFYVKKSLYKPYNLKVGEWATIAGSIWNIDGTTVGIRQYVDGESIFDGTEQAQLNTREFINNLGLFQDWDGAGKATDFFTGTTRDVKFFNRELSNEELAIETSRFLDGKSTKIHKDGILYCNQIKEGY